MREFFNAAQRLRIAVFRLKHDARAQRRHQPALSRNAELGWKLTVCAGDDIEGHGVKGVQEVNRVKVVNNSPSIFEGVAVGRGSNIKWVNEVQEVNGVNEVKEIMSCKNAKKSNYLRSQGFWPIFFHFSFNKHLLKKTFMFDCQLFTFFILRIIR